MERLNSLPPEKREEAYSSLWRRMRRKARIQMKVYLFLNWFSLSKASRKIFFSNTFRKFNAPGT